MVAYNFKDTFAGAVRNGTKHLTMRAPRRRPARHARVGDDLQLTIKARTAGITPLLAKPVCTVTAVVVLAPDGVRRVLDVTTRPGDVRAEGIAMVLRAAENGGADAARWRDVLARLDGFPDYAALYAWHRDNGTAVGKEAGGVIRRTLIGWTAH